MRSRHQPFRAILLLLVPFLLFRCGGGKDQEKASGSDRSGIKELKGSTLAKGKTIKKATFKALSGALKEHIEKGGVPEALDYCSVNALALTDSLSKNYGVRIKRVTDKPRNPFNALSEEEKAFFKKFEAKFEEGGSPDPIVHRTDSSELFFAPIAIKKGLCLKCHGKKGADIAPEHYAKIRELYPEGKATGYEMGELRGMWRIEFSRSDQKE